MYSFETKLNFGIAQISPDCDVEQLLELEGLSRDKKQLPLFSLLDLFEGLLLEKRVSKRAIKHKLLAFNNFICSKAKSQDFGALDVPIASTTSLTEAYLESEQLFFSRALINLFCYAFGLRIELFTFFGGRLTTQYFGFKGKPVRRILLAPESYIILKKITRKSNTLISKKMSKGQISSITLANQKSLKTLGTKATDRESKPLKLNKCSSAFTGISCDAKTLAKNDLCNEPDNQRPEFSKTDLFGQGDSAETAQTNICPGFGPTFQSGLPMQENLLVNHTLSLSHGQPTSPITTLEGLGSIINLPSMPQSRKAEDKSVGRLKFYNEAKEFGFIIMEDNTEIFVHKADLAKQNIDTRYLAYYKNYYEILLEFNVQDYQSKSKKHRKAVDILIFEMQAITK